MTIDMHCHVLTEEMIRLLQGVSKDHAPVLLATDRPYPSGLTTSSRGFALSFPSRGGAPSPWPEGGHNVDLCLEDMARTGVNCQAVSQNPAMYLYEIPAEVNVDIAYTDQETGFLNDQAVTLSRLDPATSQWTTAPKLVTNPEANALAASIMELGTYVVSIP